MEPDSRRDLSRARRMIAVDTNLLVYAHRPELPFHDRARQVLTEAVAASEPVCVPWPNATSFLRWSRTPISSGIPQRWTWPWMPQDGSSRVSPAGSWLKVKFTWMRSSGSPGQQCCKVQSCTMLGWPHYAYFTGCVCFGLPTEISPASRT